MKRYDSGAMNGCHHFLGHSNDASTIGSKAIFPAKKPWLLEQTEIFFHPRPQ
jgi:hypothetical protein